MTDKMADFASDFASELAAVGHPGVATLAGLLAYHRGKARLDLMRVALQKAGMPIGADVTELVEATRAKAYEEGLRAGACPIEDHDHDSGGCTCGCPVSDCPPCGGPTTQERNDLAIIVGRVLFERAGMLLDKRATERVKAELVRQVIDGGFRQANERTLSSAKGEKE